MKKDVLIIGWGVVGRHLGDFISKENVSVDIHDPYLGFNMCENKLYDIGFVCVPTNKLEDGRCDISIVEKVVKKFSDVCEVLCIKSTVPPGTTEKLSSEVNANIIFSPEFSGGSIHAKKHNEDYIILGGRKNERKIITEFYKEITHPDFRIIQTDSTTAELCKYMDNCWLANKVTFVNEFADIAKGLSVDVDELRELWLLDRRINRSHTYSFKSKPYYDSHCLNKDIPALIYFCKQHGIRVPLLMTIDIIKSFKEKLCEGKKSIAKNKKRNEEN